MPAALSGCRMDVKWDMSHINGPLSHDCTKRDAVVQYVYDTKLKKLFVMVFLLGICAKFLKIIIQLKFNLNMIENIFYVFLI